jgi:hypothetical protein
MYGIRIGAGGVLLWAGIFAAALLFCVILWAASSWGSDD